MSAPVTSVRASLIVLNFNGWELLEPCLSSLLAAIGPNDEIIVVDNGSSDGSVEQLSRKFSQVRVVALPINTYIFGLNAGLDVSSGEYVAFLNNDMTVDSDFVESCIREFSSGPDIFAVCPRILDGHGSDQGSLTAGFWSRGLLFYRSLPHSDRATDCFFAVGGQSFFNASMLREIGSIDPLLRPMYHEDVELSFRAWKRGWRIRYAPDAIAHHLGSQTSRRVFTPLELRSFVRQNEYLIVWKNLTDRRLMIEHILYLPARLIIAALKRDRATLLGFTRAVGRLPEVRRRRAVAKRHQRLSDRTVLFRINSGSRDNYNFSTNES